MEEHIYRITGINPEPWAIGPLATKVSGRKHIPFVGKNANLDNYKKSIQEALAPQNPFLMDGPCELDFYFWRKLEQYETPTGRKSQRHEADATNLQKALEDALQGYVIKNDKNVRRIESTVVEQTVDTSPGIIIVQRPYHPAAWLIPAILPDWDAERAQAESIPDLGNMI